MKRYGWRAMVSLAAAIAVAALLVGWVGAFVNLLGPTK